MPDEFDQPSRSLQEYWEEYGTILLRRRWWILLPLFFCWAVTWSLGLLWPATYQSEALVLVEQQKVPEQYVVPNVTVSLEDRLQSITQQILSRTRLQEIIDRFHLYSSHRRFAGLLAAGDPVDQMRKDIKIDLVQAPGQPGQPEQLTAFKIAYSGGSPELAQQINTELTSLFIDEDLKVQQQLSESTTAFLDSQLADSRAQLEQQEAKVRAFKMSHFGDLPSELQGNVEILSGLQSELQNTELALDGAKQQRLYLESLIQQYESAEGIQGSSTADSTATSPEALGKELLELRSQLADERSRFTDDYPDVVALKDRIARTEALRKQMLKELASNQKPSGKATNTDPVALAGIDPGAPTPMMQTESQLKANQLEIQNYEKREKHLEAEVAAYQARLNMTPEIEQKLADISRGYQETKANYDSLLKKQNQSQLATSLEQRQQGEQFQVLDAPSLPDKPASPNHLLVSFVGLLLGATVGCGLASVLELANPRAREKDLKDIVSARVLVTIPHLSTSKEERFSRRMRWMEIGVAAAMFILIALGNVYAFYKG
jgi:polysaccharide biosynthesis transport protein